MMKRYGRPLGSIARRDRVMWSRLVDVWEESCGWSGGTKRPESRKDLMFDMRRSDEADGDSNMIGSWRFDCEVSGF